MLQNDISKEQVLHFSEKLRKLISYDTETNRALIKKGLNLFRQGSVYNVKYNGKVIEGRVQDVTPVDVTLDLDFLEMSECTCPSDEFCRHRMAVFFYIFASVDRVGSLLEIWKEGNKDPSVLSSISTARKQLQQKDYKDSSLESWYSFFNREYERFSGGYPDKSQYFFATIYHTFFQTLKRRAPLQEDLKKLFHIHAALFCIQKNLEVISQINLKDYMVETYVRPYFHNFTDLVFDNCTQLKQVSLSFSLDSLLEDSMEPIRKTLLSDTLFQYERLQMYRLIWATLLNRKKWLEIEENILLEQQSANEENLEEQIAFAHLRFLQKDDVSAIQVLRDNGYQALPYSLWWISYLSETRALDRIQQWISYVLPNLSDYVFGLPNYDGRRHMTRVFLSELSEYAQQFDKELLTKAMKQLLPYSYIEYNEYLLDNEEYRKWIELQMFVGYDIDECDRYILKIIEENDREALLPLYHQAIVQAVESKNRSSYKKAVKYLKKVRTHYRRLKKEDLWEDYIIRLATANKRLRAFQEELVRASLVGN
ncbi:SWIM zinc finger family protein [Fredinandcohnia humi]